jgi:hypothetical protein
MSPSEARTPDENAPLLALFKYLRVADVSDATDAPADADMLPGAG